MRGRRAHDSRSLHPGLYPLVSGRARLARDNVHAGWQRQRPLHAGLLPEREWPRVPWWHRVYLWVIDQQSNPRRLRAQIVSPDRFVSAILITALAVGLAAGCRDDRCRKYAACKENGLCTNGGGKCIAGSNEDCRPSDLCTQEGQCTARSDRCVGTEEDCRKSKMCSVAGYCTSIMDKCVAGSDADCQQSEGCKNGHRSCKLQGHDCPVFGWH